MGTFSHVKRALREHRLSRDAYRLAGEAWTRVHVAAVQGFGGHYFTSARLDRIFGARTDPWSYAVDPVALRRRALLLERLPRARYGRLLEIGCAEGWMTEPLAARADELVAVDASRVALERARARCARLANVRLLECDVADGLPEGPFDGIVCAGVLVFLPEAIQERVRDRIVAALAPGGELLLENATRAYPGQLAGTVIDASFRRHEALSILAHERVDNYDVTLFGKQR
jgi:SAM-dependent methyltransferase